MFFLKTLFEEIHNNKQLHICYFEIHFLFHYPQQLLWIPEKYDVCSQPTKLGPYVFNDVCISPLIVISSCPSLPLLQGHKPGIVCSLYSFISLFNYIFSLKTKKVLGAYYILSIMLEVNKHLVSTLNDFQFN